MTTPGRIAAALMAVLLVVAACSGSDEADDAAAADEAGDTVVAEAATDGGGRGDGAVDAGAATVDDDPAADEGVDGEAATGPGTLVWIVGTEPPDLHLDDPANGLTITAWIREGLLESLFGVGPDLTYHPELLAAEPTVTAREDKTVVIDYRLRSDLTWSDGEPLTAEDVAYTHRILTEGCQVEADGSILDSSFQGCVYLTGNRLGIDQVTDFEVVGDTEFRVTLASFYPNWRRLYGPVLAAHAYGEDAAEVNRRLRRMQGPDGPLPSSGPLLLGPWDQGRSLTLLANESYHGSTAPEADGDGPPTIEAVRLDFEPDPVARVAAVEAGAADLLVERSRPAHGSLVEADEVVTRGLAGIDYDHWGLNLLDPHLARPEVREAVALAIDKRAIVDEVYRPLIAADADADPGPDTGDEGNGGDEDGDDQDDEADQADQAEGERNDGAVEGNGARPQGNTYWLASQPDYVDHQAVYAEADPDRAREVLEAAGYTSQSDGVYRHPTRGRLSLRVATIGGDPLREATQALLIEQLADAGIEVEADNPSGGLFFQEGPFAPDALLASSTEGAEGDPDLWDIAQFAWAGGPWPGAQSGVYRNGSPGNPYGFASPEFEVLAFECDAVVDDDERADCYNDLDRFVTTLRDGGAAPADPDGATSTDGQVEGGSSGLFMIPLVQRPLLVAHRSDRLDGVPGLSASPAGGPLARAADFRLIDE